MGSGYQRQQGKKIEGGTIKKYPLIFFLFLNSHPQHPVLNSVTCLVFSRMKLFQHFILCCYYGSISLHLALHLVFTATIDTYFLDINYIFHKKKNGRWVV